jgi:hypothetical protein
MKVSRDSANRYLTKVRIYNIHGSGIGYGSGYLAACPDASGLVPENSGTTIL